LHEQYLRERPLLEEIRQLRAGKEEAERRVQIVEKENRQLVDRVRILEEIEAKYFSRGVLEGKENFSRRASSNEMATGLISDRNKSILKNQIIQYDP